MHPYVLVVLAILCYYLTAALVLLPDTLVLRVLLLPITLYVASSALNSFDIIEITGDAGLNHMNFSVGVMMSLLSMKALVWTFCREPLQRKSPNPTGKRTRSAFLRDVFDLSINMRGIGWTWSGGYKPPPQTRPTSSTPRFLLHTFGSCVLNVIIGDFLHLAVQLTDWPSFTNPQGAPLFNPRLSPIPRYLVSSFNSVAIGLIVHSGVQSIYDSATIIGILFFNYSPIDWPPICNEPWKATSVADFWGKHWHQSFRGVFVSVGVRPMTYIFGKKSGLGVFGGFIISSIFHNLGMWRMGDKLDIFLVAGFFLMQCLGVYLEVTVVKRLFGGKVDGWKGWIWTMIWVISGSNMFVHAWCLRGVAGSMFIPTELRPSLMVYDFFQSLISK